MITNNLNTLCTLDQDSDSRDIPERNSLEVQIDQNADLTLSSVSDTSSSSVSPTPINSDVNLKKRNKLDEYYHIEGKQAKLLKILANNVYSKLNEENKKMSLCDQDEMIKVFFVVIELEKLASLVHEPAAAQLKQRVELEWNEKPYCGDILISFYHYYKVYKAVLARYPTSQIMLSNLLKRKNFATSLKRLLVC